MIAGRIEIEAVTGIGEIEPGDDLAAAIAAAAAPKPGEIFVISQKVVSKAEGRVAELADVMPGERARLLAGELGKDPRLVELILAESERVVRAERGVLITETTSGLVCANAGIDSSNAGRDGRVVLLPREPDRSARAIRSALSAAASGPVGVVVADSFGRPWRVGQTDVAIGCAGIDPLADHRGEHDRDGRTLTATAIAVADQLAAAADLARNKASGHPVVVIRGMGAAVTAGDGPGAAALRREAAADLFR